MLFCRQMIFNEVVETEGIAIEFNYSRDNFLIEKTETLNKIKENNYTVTLLWFTSCLWFSFVS